MAPTLVGADCEAMESDVAQYAHCMRVTRDVVFFFHEQSAYDHLMDDVDYSFYTEKYWEALIEDSLPLEIKRGCLALVFAMALYEAGNIGRAFQGDIDECAARLTTFVPEDDDTRRLADLVIQAVALAATDHTDRDSRAVENLLGQCEWVHRVAVQPYFNARSQQASLCDVMQNTSNI